MTTPAHQLRFATLEDVNGSVLRAMDRVNHGPWHQCIVDGRAVQVRVAMKSGRVVAVRPA